MLRDVHGPEGPAAVRMSCPKDEQSWICRSRINVPTHSLTNLPMISGLDMLAAGLELLSDHGNVAPLQAAAVPHVTAMPI